MSQIFKTNMEGEEQSPKIIYDIIILGASGFTGKYVVREALKFFDASSSSPLKTLALAGRNPSKLAQALEWAAHPNPPPAIPILTADTTDPPSLRRLCSQARLILNCVGPFRLYGEPVVAACVESGCDYLDICGEPEFMERMEAAYHEKASEKGSLVVSACGFDSVPAELGLMFNSRQWVSPAAPNRVEAYVSLESEKRVVGNMGTYESAVLGVANAGKLQEFRRSRPRRARPVIPGPPPPKGLIIIIICVFVLILKFGDFSLKRIDFGELGFCFSLMGTACAQYPFEVTAHFQEKCRVLHPKTKFSSFNFPPKLDSSRMNLYPCSSSTNSSKRYVGQICSLPDFGDFFWDRIPTPMLDMVENPMCLKNLTPKELKQLADEIRVELFCIMSKMQKPFKASLAVVELTVAIHYIFHAPMDKILWDVGEVTYAHKILTGRRALMHTLRERGGLSGFTSRSESEYDPFGAGHGCSSISAGLGMAVARDLKGKRERIVTVIGNGTTMAGQVYEAMGNAGYLDSNMVVILNDSRHSLHPKLEDGQATPINALSSTLTKLQSSKSFRKFREAAKGVTKRIGKGMHELAAKVDEYARGMVGPLGATLFEELGLYYIGPVDGHNIEDLISVLQGVASLDPTGPVLVHVITKEYQGVEASQKSMISNGHLEGFYTSELSPYPLPRMYSDCFVEALVNEAEKDKDIVVVHAGMGMEPPLQLFQEKFPYKFFDVGMAEQHAVTFSAGLACGGLKPFCIIPSTFLQRAYDQVVHDVDRQRIPVRFAITSAGLVGSDGPTRCGAFDITFMSCLPNMIVMAPSDENELMHMVATAAHVDDRPICFRYPRGATAGMSNSIWNGIPIEIGKGKVLIEGKDVALLGYGVMVQNCLKAWSLLSELGIRVTVADARFCKPLDIQLVRELCENHAFLITVEEGSVGGFGSHVAQFIALDGKLDGRIKWRPIALPDNYIEQASPEEQLAIAGLTGHHIAATVLSLLGRNREALLLMQ